jgi:hypothetical protein
MAQGQEGSIMQNSRTLTPTPEQLYFAYVNEKLKEAEEWAGNPNAKWLTESELFARAERDSRVFVTNV